MPTIQIEVHQRGRTTSAALVRGHQIVVDRPNEKNGDDKGPMGGELLLVGLGGCFMSNLLAVIRERKVDVTNVKTNITATIAQSPARFSAVALCVSADCEDRTLLEELVTIAERGCIVANTLRTGTVLTAKIA
jgi:putative redox protein